jgi:hypothetical protein
MKKKIFCGIAVLTVTTMATFALTATLNKGTALNIAPSNVKALATAAIQEVCFQDYIPFPDEGYADDCDKNKCNYYPECIYARICKDCRLYRVICVYNPSKCP